MTDREVREFRFPGASKRVARQWRQHGQDTGFGVRVKRGRNADGTPGDRVITVSVRKQNIDSPRAIEE